MPIQSLSETKCVRYLLGQCSAAEREVTEAEYFEDEDAFAEMLTAEADLIDAYARGELSGEEQQRFERIFVSSPRRRRRVRFARAFAKSISVTRSVESNVSGKLLDITFQSHRLSRTATIAAVIVFVAVLAGMAIDRRRMTNELRELRAEITEFSKRTEALQRSNDTERTRTAEVAAQLEDSRSHSDQPSHQESKITATQQPRHSTKLKNDGEKIASNEAKPVEKHINTQDASLENTWAILTGLPIRGRRWSKLLTPQPATSRNMSEGGTTVRGTIRDPNGNLVSGATVILTNPTRNFTKTQSTNEDGTYVFDAIPPGTYSLEVRALGFKRASTSDLTVVDATFRDVQLEVGAVSETVDITSAVEASTTTSDASLGNSFERKRITELPLNANNVVGLRSLQPDVSRTGAVNGGRDDESGITLDGLDVTPALRVIGFRGSRWIRFQVVLETAAIHEVYYVVIRTVDGRPVTSVKWIEPLMPNQIVIDTPVISTGDLPPGNYVFLLMGKASDGSFVKVAEYSLKVVKY